MLPKQPPYCPRFLLLPLCVLLSASCADSRDDGEGTPGSGGTAAAAGTAGATSSGGGAGTAGGAAGGNASGAGGAAGGTPGGAAGSSTGGDSPGTGGESGAPSRAELYQGVAAYCARFETQCPATDEEACTSEWEASADLALTDDCAAELEALFQCLEGVPADSIVCFEDNAQYPPGTCTEELNAYNGCP